MASCYVIFDRYKLMFIQWQEHFDRFLEDKSEEIRNHIAKRKMKTMQIKIMLISFK